MSGLSLEQRLAQRGLLGAVEKVARKHHVTMGELLGRRRLAHIVAARHAAWWEMRAKGLSYPAIAWLFGVNHTTVISACGKEKVRNGRQEIRGDEPGAATSKPDSVLGEMLSLREPDVSGPPPGPEGGEGSGDLQGMPLCDWSLRLLR